LPPPPEEAPDSIPSLDAAAASPLPMPPTPVAPVAAVDAAPDTAAPAIPDSPPTSGDPLASAPADGHDVSPIKDTAATALDSNAAEAMHTDEGLAAGHEPPALPSVAAAAPVAHLEIPHAATTPAPVTLRARWQGWWDEFMAWVRVFASAAVYATLIVTFLFQVARVDGQSMAPTLEDRDRLIVNKLAYRIGEPQRGDIVMLYYPLDPDKSYVKRVIAEEGDMVRVVDGQVFVNDVPLPDDQIPPEYRSHDEWGPQVIPEGYYFVMGDHRNNSSDSRHWGFVPKKYIIGRVQVRWWPFPTATVF